MKKYFLRTLMLCMCSASNWVYANQWVYGDVSMVEEYGSYEDYQILITLVNQEWIGTKGGESACTGRFSVEVGQEGVTDKIQDRIFSLMLSAYMGGKKAGLFVNPETGPYCKVQIGRIGDGF